MADSMTTDWNKNETRFGEMGEKSTSTTEKVEGVISAVGDKADDAASSVGSCMTSFADTIRERAPEEGVLGSAASKTAETFDTAGRYLRDEGVTGMGHDVTCMIRRNPVPALLVGLGVGFLLARATRR